MNILSAKFQSLLLAAILAISFSIPSAPVAAYDGCGGVVRGLSPHYDFNRGSGFLAVRVRPTSRSRMRDQLFNGETVQIFGRRGNWYQISYSRGQGWVFARYVRNECGY